MQKEGWPGKVPWLTEDVAWNNSMIKKAVTHLALSLGKPILKLTNNDYNENGLSDLLALYGQAYDINIEVFNGCSMPLPDGQVVNGMPMTPTDLKEQHLPRKGC